MIRTALSIALYARVICARAVLGILVCVLPAWSQLNTADIVGTVMDSSGAVLPNAKITAENVATKSVRMAAADSGGNFLFTLLPVGRYTVTAELAGFKTSTVPDIALAVGDRLRLDMRLEVGQIEQKIEVRAQSPALKSETSSLGTLVNDRAAQDLPLNGRNFIRLAQLAVGANESVPNAQMGGNLVADRRRTSAVSANGQRDFLNNFLIDGMDNNERFIGTVIVKPSMEALAEFKVETNLYSAEVGRAAGAIVNLVTKSGTNIFHGSLFEFFRNEKVDAKNFFARRGPTPSYKQNQFGGSLGGPIRKNRTFFFGDYEGLRLRQALTATSTVPTLEMRNGDFSGINPIFDPLTGRPNPAQAGGFLRDRFPNDRIPASRIDAVALRLLQLYPLPQNSALVNNFTMSPSKKQRDDGFDARIDQYFSEKDTFFGRYSFNDTNTEQPPQLPAVGDINPTGDSLFPGPTLQRSQGINLNYVHTFRPTLLMELKAGFTRMGLASLPLNYGKNVSEQLGIRGANIDSDSSGLTPIAIAGFRGIGDSSFIPYIAVNNIFQYVGNVTYIHSRHSIKFGGDLRRRQVTPFQSPLAKGQFSFNSNFTNDPSGAVPRSGNALASFLLGLPASTARSKYLVWPGFRSTEMGAYLQDDFKAARWLTLNLGVRWDVFTPLAEVANRISNVDFATGRIIIAGQDGISSSAGVATDWNNFAPRFGFAATLTPRTVLRGGYGISFYTGTSGSSTAFRNPPFVSLLNITATPITPINRLADGFPAPIAGDPKNPTGNLTAVARDLRDPYVQQYNITLQQQLFSDMVLSVGYVGALSRKQVFGPNVNLALPGPGAIDPRRPYFTMFPSVANINVAGSWGTGDYHALQASVEHRFANGLNLITHYTWSHNIDDNPALNGGKPGSGPFPQLVNNWRLERGNSDVDLRHRWVFMANYELPFAKGASGMMRAVAHGWQMNAIAVLQSGLPFTVSNAAPRANTGGGDRPNQIASGELPASERSVTRWFNTSAFVPQPLYQIGNTGRNTLFAAGQKNLDFSLFKDFPIAEHGKLQFRTEVFNITNTPNFGIPGSALGAATFGVISDTGNALPRNIQFALKYLF